jgi:hypothetical protein
MSISVRIRSRAREDVSSPSATKPCASAVKPFTQATKKSGNDIIVVMGRGDQTMESIMWNLIGILYRGYCLARLREMRRSAHH